MVERVSTGIKGLDEILHGGIIKNRATLIRGGPGSGKTTFGFHFLMDGAQKGEKVLFITLGENKKQLIENALSLNIPITGIEFLDLSPSPEFFSQVESYDIFSPAEVEREPVTQMIINTVNSLNPTRIFIDSMTQFRYLAPDTFQFRKQVLSFIRFLTEKGATVIFTSEASSEAPDDDLMFLADGIINLVVRDGSRFLRVSKLRGSIFMVGEHEYVIKEGGVVIYPRLIPEKYSKKFTFDQFSSGIPSLDKLLNGGIERGTITIISGPTGVGKSTLGLVFIKEAAQKGEKSVLYTFEETKEKILARCDSIKIPARKMMEKGTLKIKRIEPLTLLPDEFASIVKEDVMEWGASLVMIDSTSGYEITVGGKSPREHLHAICRYLSNMGVLVILTTEIRNITGEFRISDHNISYLADNIIFLRYLEMSGEIKRAIGVLKKRLSNFEKTLREYYITDSGIQVGEPLSNLRNILSGTPIFV